METDFGEIKKMKDIVIVRNKWRIVQLWIYIILLFPLLAENIISTILGDDISKILSVVSCGVMLLMIFKQKLHINGFILGMILLVLLHVIITFVFVPSTIKITVANNLVAPYGLIGYFMLFLFIDAYLDKPDTLIAIFHSMMVIMTISVLVNFIFTADFQIADNILVFKEALRTGYTNSRQWLFGHRNMIFIHHLMWILFSYITYKLEHRNYTNLFIVQILYTMVVGVVSWNSTMMFTTVIIFVLAFFRNGIFSKMTIIHYVLLYLFLEIGIVFLRIQDFFSYIIVSILHRNLSLTGRTSIWDYYIKQFSDENLFQKLFGNFGVTQLSVNTHNMFLGLLVFTGVIGLTLYFVLLYLAIVNLIKEKNTDLARFVSVILFGFLINALTMEFYLQPLTAIYVGYRIRKINQLIN